MGDESIAEPPRDLLDEPPVRPLTWPLRFVLIIGVTVLAARLTTLQLVQGSANKVLAEGNSLRTRPIEAPRGLILDRYGRSLVTNMASFSLELIPSDLPQSASDRQKLYEAIAPLSNTTPDVLKKQIEHAGLYSLEPVVLLDNLTHDQSLALELQTKDLAGVEVAQYAVRHYVTDGAFGNVLGYTGKITQQELDDHPNDLVTSRIGKTGVEQSYDDILRGEPGTETIEVDSKGVVQRSTETTVPAPGQNVVLGIDEDLQKVAADALQAQLTQQNVKAGAIVGIDPRDGTVRLMVSMPSYDDNLFSQSISSADFSKLINDPTNPLMNRVISGQYPPGSTIKPVVAVGGLANGVITKNTTIDAPAQITVGSYVFPDWRKQGIENVTRAIAVSSDVFFYAVGGGWDKISGLGIDRLAQTYQLFGLGKATGIDLSGEKVGLVPTPAWKKKAQNQSWYLGDTYHVSIGQGDLLTTPLQLVQTVSTIANGGTRYVPHVVEATIDPTTNVRTPVKPVVAAQNFEPADAIQTAREGMLQTVDDGSGRALKNLSIQVAGKTGTAQFNNNSQTHAWFSSFAPYDNPKLALVILVEGGGEGNISAVPIAQTIYQWIADHGFDGSN